MVIPVFLPHAGCNEQRCTYCHQGYITDISEVDLRARIDGTLSGRSEPCEVGLFGGNIFGIEPAALERIFSFFDNYRHVINAFRISTKPLPLHEETIAILKQNGVAIIELGMPTFNDAILAAVNRGHTTEDLFYANDRLSNEGFRIALQFMVGLPGETQVDIYRTTENMIRLKPVYVRVYPLVVLRGTELYDLYKNGSFVPDNFDNILYRAIFIYLNALKAGIDVANIGLTANKPIGAAVAGGFYHPAYGFLVQSRAFRLAIEYKIKKLSNRHKVTVIIHRNDIPLLVGYKRENLAMFASSGTTLRWEASGDVRGSFDLHNGSEKTSGTIIDALHTFKKETTDISNDENSVPEPQPSLILSTTIVQ